MTTINPNQNQSASTRKPCSEFTMRLIKRYKLLSTLLVVAGIVIPVWLYASTYREVKSQVQQIESIENRALEIDENLTELCLKQDSVKRCRILFRDLLALLKEPEVTPAVSKMALTWGQLISLEHCEDVRCRNRVAWTSGAGDDDYDYDYYAQHPDQLKAYMLSQLEVSRQTLIDHDAAQKSQSD